MKEPTTMPWGHRSLLFGDPDGNLVDFFTHVASVAIEKFARWPYRPPAPAQSGWRSADVSCGSTPSGAVDGSRD
jgi:hypothetical protein